MHRKHFDVDLRFTTTDGSLLVLRIVAAVDCRLLLAVDEWLLAALDQGLLDFGSNYGQSSEVEPRDEHVALRSYLEAFLDHDVA